MKQTGGFKKQMDKAGSNEKARDVLAQAGMKLTDDELEQVNGGFMSFNRNTCTMDYVHEDGSVSSHHINNYNKAWDLSNELHAQNVPEDEILARLIDAKYIQ